MRSLLFVPGHDSRKMDKALASAADALVLDLEDAVPEADKARARGLCADFLRAHAAQRPLFVRMNELGSSHWQADLQAVLPGRPRGIMVPKCEGPQDLQTVGAVLTDLERQLGLPEGSTRLLPIVTETAAGVLRLPLFAQSSSPRLCAMLWGGEDLAADIGASHNRDAAGGYTALYQLARSLTLLGATASRVGAIDAVYANFRDTAGLQAELAQAVRDGFVGKAAIHPDQIGPIHAAFTPTDDEVAAARRVVDAFEAASATGVASLDGKMIVRPYYLAALRVLARVPAALQP